MSSYLLQRQFADIDELAFPQQNRSSLRVVFVFRYEEACLKTAAGMALTCAAFKTRQARY
ncbi:hypothetical protein N182_32920 [Sinorhizobium sp. GL2]|nr:hypothetical protein N182_32920 [Sinorhizobium sp. GL2]